MKITAILGDESHTTSAAWSKLTINGKRVYPRDAITKKWLYYDRHLRWAECVFDVPEGAEIVWQVGVNRGYYGADRTRHQLVFVADPNAEWESTIPILGFRSVFIKGSIRPISQSVKKL